MIADYYTEFCHRTNYLQLNFSSYNNSVSEAAVDGAKTLLTLPYFL